LQADGYGEVEIHLHHGVEQPDTAENTRRQLETFRDVLAEEHKCLARSVSPLDSQPKYGFVHGNWALANSAGGRFCVLIPKCKSSQTLAATPTSLCLQCRISRR